MDNNKRLTSRCTRPLVAAESGFVSFFFVFISLSCFVVFIAAGELYVRQKMKMRNIIRLFAVILVTAALFLIWHDRNKDANKSWPKYQLVNARSLGIALSSYKEKRGSYPNDLTDLVTCGIMTDADFDRLQFKVTRDSEPEAWLYNLPISSSDVAIVSPRAIYPWDGHFGYIVVSSADGSGKLRSRSKLKSLPEWAKHKLGEQVAAPDGE